jgi:hypothetical protein
MMVIEKARTLCLVIALTLGGGLGARGTAPDARTPALKLTAEIVGRRYCAGNRLNILQLSVRLRYQNAGSQKLILYRGKNFFYQTRIRGGAAQGKPYEVVVLNSRYNDALAEDVNTRRPGSAFITLPPGGTYEDGIVVGVAVTPAGSERVANSITPGEHTLQIIASSWYESRKLAEELRGRWQGSGLLWIDPAATQTMEFDAEGGVPATACR